MIRALIVTMALALSSSAFAAGHRPPPAPPVSGVVNLNTASAKQLALLPGVGPSRANAILAYREKNHFTKTEQIRQVKGVGKGVFKKIATHIAVSGPNTLARIP